MGETTHTFYRTMAFLFVAIALVGFAPTFYLRGYLPLPPGFPPLTPMIAAHVAVETLWLIIFAMQVSFVARRRMNLHRQLGVASLIVAIGMVVLGTLATLNGFRRGAALNGVDPRVWWLGVTFPGVPMFAGLVGAGYWYRRRPGVHKRLMLMATLNMMQPAVARFTILTFGAEMTLPIGLAVTLVLLSFVFAFDLRTTRRVHPATIAGAAVTLLVPLVAPRLAATAPALAFAEFVR